ncbi:MAG: 4'-phosphopantetheinyl transferase superfamily protein [Microscillaceae bacterium]|nr:4'-phosphopantetheinyl transferase superfamily protein [Microscillaceae bacterium]MDW8461714.1 4'-phosphopantetheinyl transferase superfamily protein [Cytophagales bacterium]
MPLLKLQSFSNYSAWALWQITENENNLYQILQPGIIDNHFLHTISHSERRKGSLAARICSKILAEQFLGVSYQGIVKDLHNYPSLAYLPNVHLSISHTQGYAVAMIHTQQPVGIDIELEREKIIRLANKFLHPKEHTWVNKDITKLTLIWSAKEALYKCYGRKLLSFSQNLQITPFEINANTGILLANVFLQKQVQSHHLSYQRIDRNYWLSWVSF